MTSEDCTVPPGGRGRGRHPEDSLCVIVGEAVGGRTAWRDGKTLPDRKRERREGPVMSDSPPGPQSGPTLGTANLP